MAPAHSHNHFEETVVGIEGVSTWTVNGQQIDVGPGQALCIPRGAVHRFDNNGTEDVRGVCAITPAAPLILENSDALTRRVRVRL